MATEVCPKGRKYIGGGEAPVYEKYQIHSPNGAAEIMEIIINFVSYSYTQTPLGNPYRNTPPTPIFRGESGSPL